MHDLYVMQDIVWHHKMCQYANYPHNNILPNLPARKKTTATAPKIVDKKAAPDL